MLPPRPRLAAPSNQTVIVVEGSPADVWSPLPGLRAVPGPCLGMVGGTCSAARHSSSCLRNAYRSCTLSLESHKAPSAFRSNLQNKKTKRQSRKILGLPLYILISQQ
ncbi:unnamed protein product [Linum trigynum]|uniref:Uncharacterized protein n=1 Tax=Linum trigynum TaxID=586398 RepID=A0AAV2DR06_9ROSI